MISKYPGALLGFELTALFMINLAFFKSPISSFVFTTMEFRSVKYPFIKWVTIGINGAFSFYLVLLFVKFDVEHGLPRISDFVDIQNTRLLSILCGYVNGTRIRGFV